MSVWDPRTTIATKRDGGTLPEAEVERFVLAYAAGQVDDGPAAAFLMASLLNGLDEGETLAMTRAMIASGDTVSFGDLGRPSVDKHSTGGVADGVTLVFAPLAAALGLAVAKLSGRGLGHTGGTLDKLEAIPGFRTDLEPDRIARQVRETGCAIAAQSPGLVPGDGALYALRDATATVPSVPLIAASVMAKKLAVDSDLILLDVKAGSGAFMKTVEDAGELADACRALARGAGRRCGVAITDMSHPLGDAVGNALDVAEAIGVLSGAHHGNLRDLAVWFAARALESAGGVSFEDARTRAATALDDGSARERFARMVEAQGGDPRVVDDPASVLPRAPVVLTLRADRSGTVLAMTAEDIGHAAGALGAGRMRKGDPIDPAVGIVLRPKIGDRVEAGEAIGEVHARTDSDAEEAARRTLAALSLGDGPAAGPPPRRGGGGGASPSGRPEPGGIVTRIEAVGNFTGLGVRLAIYMAASLLVGMCLREYVRARAIVSVGDPTPRLWGRVSWAPKTWFEPFGSGVLPGLIVILWMAQALLIPAAYGKPAPTDPARFRRPVRDTVVVSLVGPAATAVLGVAAGLVFRLHGLPIEWYRIALTLCFTSMSLTVFHLLPIPGLDGARMLALALPPDAARVYRDFDKYLPLLVLVILFLFSSLALGLLTSISGALCNAATGSDCVVLLQF